MEGEDRKQFICRHCDKRYPCGKSLGGHLRSHTIARAVKDRAGIENVIRPKPNLSPPNHDAASDSAAYVLRENPKKTWRFAGSRGGGGGAPEHQPERFCKECGKGFQSMKALCGHMACHSDKDRDKDKVVMMSRRFTAEEKEVLDSQSETETTSGPRRGKRSKRLRYKTLDFNSNSSLSYSVANGSSSVSEIEQEQEEVAMCLMMLSRDYGYGKGFNSFAESSDNNSVVLEAKSSSIDMKKNGFGLPATSDSGYFRNKYEAKRVKSDEFERDCGFNNLKGKNKFRFESLERGSNKQPKQIKPDQSVNHCPIYGRSTRIKDHELWEICHKKIENGTASNEIAPKTRDKFINGCSDSICESGENSIEADSFHNSSKAKVNKSLSFKVTKKPVDQDFSGKAKKRLGTKKIKGHKCPICFRVFKSGQALGGHKRSHFLGGSDGRTVVVLAKQQVGLLDLNLPAPDEEEDTPGSW